MYNVANVPPVEADQAQSTESFRATALFQGPTLSSFLVKKELFVEEVDVLCNVNGYLQTDRKVWGRFDISGHIGYLPKQQAWDIELLSGVKPSCLLS